MNNQKCITALLENGDKFSIQNVKSYNRVLQSIEKIRPIFYNINTNKDNKELCNHSPFHVHKGPLRDRISLVLSVHVKYNDISHFHAACMLNCKEAVEFFWKIRVPLNEVVNVDSKILSGDTTLHFAAKYSIVNAAKALLARGAEVHLRDVEGQTPLDILIAGSMEIIDNIRMGKGGVYKKLIEELNSKKCIIEMILKKISDSNQVILTSPEYQPDISSFDNRLWVEIRKSSWQGYTPLPCSLYIYIGLEAIEDSKLNREPRTTKKSLISLRSFMSKFPFDESQCRWRNILFLDNKTSLTEFYTAMKDTSSFEDFMKKNGNNFSMIIPHDSPVLPGCTPLHLAIIFAVKKDYNQIVRNIFDFQNKSDSESHNWIGVSKKMYKDMIKHCLKLGADVRIPDKHGTTPIQLASELLAMPCSELVQTIASSCNDENFGKYSSKNSDINPENKFGSNVYYLKELAPVVHQKIIELQIRQGANFLNSSKMQPIMKKLYKSQPNLFYQIVDGFASKNNSANLTALHAACLKLDYDAVEKCLYFQHSNVQTNSSNAFWAGFTPLHFVTMNRDTYDVIKIISIASSLLEWDADDTLKNANGLTPLHQALNNICFQQSIYIDRKRIEFLNVLFRGYHKINVDTTDPSGISHFHIACTCNQVTLVDQFLKNGVDVNKKISEHSNIFPGFTPLHLAARYQSDETLDLLLKFGADVNARNCTGSTPLHEAANYYGHSKMIVGYEEKSGAVVKSLVRAGADLNAKNLYGQTALELLLKMTKIASETFKLLSKNRLRVNLFNRISGIGLIGVAMIFLRDVNALETNSIYMTVINNPEKNKADSTGRSPVHNIAALPSYTSKSNIIKSTPCEVLTLAIRNFIRLGFDVDQQDCEGRTALHVAVKFLNATAVDALLSLGCDMNIEEITGETPLSCLEKTELDSKLELDDKVLKHISAQKMNCLRSFFHHIHKMKLAGLHISKTNEEVCTELQKQISVVDNFIRKCQDELNIMANKKIGSSALYFGGFLVKVEKTVAVYQNLDPKKRLGVDIIFHNMHNIRKDFPEFAGLLLMQYRHLRNKSKTPKTTFSLVQMVMDLFNLKKFLSFKKTRTDDKEIERYENKGSNMWNGLVNVFVSIRGWFSKRSTRYRYIRSSI